MDAWMDRYNEKNSSKIFEPKKNIKRLLRLRLVGLQIAIKYDLLHLRNFWRHGPHLDHSLEQTCSFISLVLKSLAVAVLIVTIPASLEFSTCSHCSKSLRSWE